MAVKLMVFMPIALVVAGCDYLGNSSAYGGGYSGYSPYYAAPYGPGWGGGYWYDYDRPQHQWHDGGGWRNYSSGPPQVAAPPAMPPSQVQQNQRLLDQLGFQRNR